MNENEQIDNVDAGEPREDQISVVRLPAGRRIHPAVIAVLGIAAAVLVLLIVWLAVFRNSEVGQPVPAPRSSSLDTAPQGQAESGQTITISAEQLASSGIQIETIGEQMAAEVGLTAATGVVEPNAYRNTPALTLIGGVVRRVIPELGDQVLAGQTVAVIFSNEFAEAQSRFIALETEVKNAKQNYERTQRLVVINQPGKAEVDAATRQVKASEAALTEMQNRYQRTSRLVIIGAASREDLEQDTTKLRAAEAEAVEARNRLDRANSILAVNPETRAQNEEALNKLRGAESELASVRQRLLLYGMSSGQMSSLHNASQITSELAVPAPISGIITERSVNAGEPVEANKELMRITDLSSVWVAAQAFEKDLPKLRTGTGASITSKVFPERIFRGQVTYIDPSVDPATRTAKVRVELANPGRVLKLGMFVDVSFGSLGNSERTVPVVPSSAVQNVDSRQVLFLATSDPNVFELRPVRVGSEVNGRVPILEGANVGDRVVTTGSFMLRAEWSKTHQQ